MNRLLLAFAAYIVLAVLSWATISDQRLRLATWALLALFAVKTWVRRHDTIHSNQSDAD